MAQIIAWGVVEAATAVAYAAMGHADKGKYSEQEVDMHVDEADKPNAPKGPEDHNVDPRAETPQQISDRNRKKLQEEDKRRKNTRSSSKPGGGKPLPPRSGEEREDRTAKERDPAHERDLERRRRKEEEDAISDWKRVHMKVKSEDSSTKNTTKTSTRAHSGPLTQVKPVSSTVSVQQTSQGTVQSAPVAHVHATHKHIHRTGQQHVLHTQHTAPLNQQKEWEMTHNWAVWEGWNERITHRYTHSNPGWMRSRYLQSNLESILAYNMRTHGADSHVAEIAASLHVSEAILLAGAKPGHLGYAEYKHVALEAYARHLMKVAFKEDGTHKYIFDHGDFARQVVADATHMHHKRRLIEPDILEKMHKMSQDMNSLMGVMIMTGATVLPNYWSTAEMVHAGYIPRPALDSALRQSDDVMRGMSKIDVTGLLRHYVGGAPADWYKDGGRNTIARLGVSVFGEAAMHELILWWDGSSRVKDPATGDDFEVGAMTTAMTLALCAWEAHASLGTAAAMAALGNTPGAIAAIAPLFVRAGKFLSDVALRDQRRGRHGDESGSGKHRQLVRDLKASLASMRYNIDTRFTARSQSMVSGSGLYEGARQVMGASSHHLQRAYGDYASSVKTERFTSVGKAALEAMGITVYMGTGQYGRTMEYAVPRNIPSTPTLQASLNTFANAQGRFDHKRADVFVDTVMKLRLAEATREGVAHNAKVRVMGGGGGGGGGGGVRRKHERVRNVRERFFKMPPAPKIRPTFGSHDWRAPRIQLAQQRGKYRTRGGTDNAAQSYSAYGGGRSTAAASLAAGRGGGVSRGRGRGFGGGNGGGQPPRRTTAFQATNAAPRSGASVNWLQMLRRREPDAQPGQTQSYYARGLVERYMPAQWYHQPLTAAERNRGDPSGQIHNVAPGVATALGRNTGEVIDFLIRESEM